MNRVLECLRCGADISDRISSATFCSNACCIKFNRDKDREVYNEWQRDYRAADPQRWRDWAKRWRLENTEKAAAHNRRHYLRHRTKILEYGRRRRAAMHERYLELYRAAYWRDKAYARARNRAWSAANPELVQARRHRRRARVEGAVGSFTAAEWRAIVTKQKGKCAECGERRRLSVDHIIPLARGGTNFAFNIQGLCRPCNSRKRTRLDPGAQHTLFDRTDLAS